MDYASHPLEVSQQVLRRPRAPVSLDMAPWPPENSPRVLRGLWAPVSINTAPYIPEVKGQVLRRPETHVSVDLAPTSFLRLTTGADKAGVFCLHGSIPIFPEVYTGGSEDISVLLCGRGPMSSHNVTAGSEEARAPDTVDAALTFQKPQLMS